MLAYPSLRMDSKMRENDSRRTIEKMPTMKMEKWCCKKRPKTLNVIEAIKNANMQKKLLAFCMNDSNWKRERTKKCLNDSNRAKTLKCKSINLTKIRTINLMNRNWRVSFHGFGSSVYNFFIVGFETY